MSNTGMEKVRQGVMHMFPNERMKISIKQEVL